MVEILIVEDDPNIARTIEVTISLVGYECRICGDGAAAVQEVLEHDYDLVLLDVMLPGMDGFEVIQKIQSKGTPVIFLTALQDVTDKVKGLRLGAEDYIVKPFEAVELLARIEVVLRRSHKGRVQIVYDDITIDMDRHLVTKAGEPVALTPKEFSLLAFFMENVDVAVTRERLLAAVWGYEFQGESRTVDIHVQQLRKKLDLSRRLITIPKLGYRLESRSSLEIVGQAFPRFHEAVAEDFFSFSCGGFGGGVHYRLVSAGKLFFRFRGEGKNAGCIFP